MYLNGHKLSEDQQKDLSGITEALCQKFEIRHIFLFGSRKSEASDCSCFTQNRYTVLKAYAILVVANTRQGQQQTMQDFISRRFPELEITLLCHWSGQVDKLLGEGNRFFVWVFNYGLLLTTSDGYNAMSYSYCGEPVQYHQDALQYFNHHSALSKGFLTFARKGLADQDLKLGLFFLHQATEQAAIGLIRVFTGYRYNIHNLSRLFALCRYFSSKISQIFSGSKHDQILLHKLNSAYLGTRYQNDFQICATQAQTLLRKVEIFKDVSAGLCGKKLVLLQQQTNKPGHTLNSYNYE